MRLTLTVLSLLLLCGCGGLYYAHGMGVGPAYLGSGFLILLALIVIIGSVAL